MPTNGKNTETDTKKKTRTGGATKRSTAAQVFQRAYFDFLRVQQDAQLTAQQSTMEAWTGMTAEQQEVYEAALQPVAEAQRKLQTLQTQAFTASNEEAQKDIYAAANAVNQAQVEFWADAEAGERCQEAYAAFLNTSQASWDEAQQQQQKAYQDLVAGLQKAWAQVDAANVDADTLATMQWATQVVACLRGPGA